MFKDRTEAGQLLGQKIAEKYSDIQDGIVIALPRGGVVIASEVAKTLKLPLDIVVTRKIGAPLNSEYAIAAVSEHEIILSPNESPERGFIEKKVQKERLEIARRYQEYRGSKPALDLRGKTVFLVDDGLATGLTMQVAIQEVQKKKPAKLVLAVPVAPPDTVEKLKRSVDDILVLKTDPMFFAVGAFYQDFPQLTDDEVKRLLKSS